MDHLDRLQHDNTIAGTSQLKNDRWPVRITFSLYQAHEPVSVSV